MPHAAIAVIRSGIIAFHSEIDCAAARARSSRILCTAIADARAVQLSLPLPTHSRLLADRRASKDLG